MKQTITTGRELYNLQIAGDINKGAIKQIEDGVLAGLATDVTLDDYNWVNRLTKGLLINGSLIIVDRTIAEGDVLFIEEVDETIIAYQLISDEGASFLKVWERGERTFVTSYPAPPSCGSLKLVKDHVEKSTELAKPIDLESQDVIFIENGRGILVGAEATLLRLSELMGLLSSSISQKALRWFVTSYTADIHQLNTVQGSVGPYGTIPDGASFQHMYDSAYTNDVFTEVNSLMPAFKDAVSNFVITPGESGISRFVGLQPYINLVTHTQRIVKNVLEQQGITIEWRNVVFEALRLEIASSSETPI